jgi:hypothetical protein
MPARHKVASALVALAFAVCIPTVARADVSGNWQIVGHIELPNGNVFQSSPVCKFKQDGVAISGQCKGPNSAGTAKGTLTGDKVVFQMYTHAITPYGFNGTSYFSGVIGPDGVMRGTYTTSETEGYSGAWTGTPIK